MKYLTIILLLFIFFACQEDKTEITVPVIYLNPDEAREMKMSDYFDNYEVVALKDIVCRSVDDVIEFPDRWVALLYERANKFFLYAYDKSGNPLCPVGALGRGPGEYNTAGKEICLERDSTIMVYDELLKRLKFSKEGDLLDEKIWKDQFDSKYGNPVYYLNDFTLLYHYEAIYSSSGPGYQDNARFMKNIKGKHLLNIVSTRPGGEVLSYWDAEDLHLFQLNDLVYIFRDTCCFYIEKAGEVYNVFEKGIEPRYRVDRGKHAGLWTKEEFFAGVTTDKIRMMSINETDKYVLGIYLFERRYYIFIYNKAARQTVNYETLDDDLLKVGVRKNDFFPSPYLTRWLAHRHFNQEGMIFLLEPGRFARMIESIRENRSEEEWKQYCEEHADLIRAYEESKDDTYGIILKYKYR